MKPIDFVIFDGDSSPNDPIYEVAEAMNKPIEINGMDGEYEILSYYLHDGAMNLDIRKKGGKHD